MGGQSRFACSCFLSSLSSARSAADSNIIGSHDFRRPHALGGAGLTRVIARTQGGSADKTTPKMKTYAPAIAAPVIETAAAFPLLIAAATLKQGEFM